MGTTPESRLEVLELRHSDFKDEMDKLSADIRELVVVMRQLTEDRAAFSVAIDRITKLDEKVSELSRLQQEYERKQLEQENQRLRDNQTASDDQKRKAWGELLKVVLLVMASMFAYHFGIKLL